MLKYEDERVLYAFQSDKDIKYIGICDNTSTTLKDRMTRYQGMSGSGANERIAGLIRDELNKGCNVDIYVLLPNGVYTYKDFNIDMIKGLEFPLIGKLKPHWNKQK